MRLRVVMALALVLAVLSCFPASAGAGTRHYVLPAGQFTTMELEGSNGYRIRIFVGSRGYVALEAIKQGVHTEYESRGAHVSADRVEAKLPGLGSISLRFHQHGRARRSSPIGGCDGPRPTVRRGVVRGVIEFVGERDYTQVEADEADAEVDEWARQRCRYGSPPRGRHHRRKWTNALRVWGNGSGVNFFATKYRPGAIEGGRVVFTATASTVRKSLRIFRRATVLAPASTFQIPEPDTYPEHVILSPPAPFTGTGTFARTPESVFVWEGDLAIQFPGIDPIPLTGPGFEPHYCALRGCVDQYAESESGTG